MKALAKQDQNPTPDRLIEL